MNRKELIEKILEEMGYKPEVDNDGDLCIQYQMKSVFFLCNDKEESYVSVMLPQFSDVEEGQETFALAACNKVTRELKMLKVYVDKNFRTISATCEFYFTDEESLRSLIEHSLSVLSVARTIYRRTHDELSE